MQNGIKKKYLSEDVLIKERGKSYTGILKEVKPEVKINDISQPIRIIESIREENVLIQLEPAVRPMKLNTHLTII